MLHRRFLCSLSLLALVAAAGAAPGSPIRSPAAGPLTRYEFVAPQMGTLFRIVLYAPTAADAKEATAAAFARVAELNRIMSDYDPGSEMMRLSANPPGTAVAVSAELFDIVQRSQRLAEKSGGAFDVTLGPLVRLWREARRTRQLPTEAARTEALRALGFTKLRLNARDQTIALLSPGMQLDFGGIAKGYAADEALAVLARFGLVHAMVAASGDLALGDAPPGAPGWKVELTPFGPTSPERLMFTAEHVGISTSGAAEQSAEIDGVRYSHIINPATALGLTQPVAVTVIAGDATRSDGLATACSVLAVTAANKIPDCVGDSARAIVFRRDESGAVQRETYGTSPPGLHPAL